MSVLSGCVTFAICIYEMTYFCSKSVEILKLLLRSQLPLSDLGTHQRQLPGYPPPPALNAYFWPWRLSFLLSKESTEL